MIYNGVPVMPGWPARIKAAQQVTHYTTRDGRVLARIRYGDEPGIGTVARKPCRDCGVLKGQYHVGPACGLERCPNCGGQFSSCDCDFVGDEGDDEDFGTTDSYHRAFGALRGDGLSGPYLALLRAHHAAPNHTATFSQLAVAVGVADGSAVNRLYRRLSERVGRQLGIDYPPHEFWPYVLVRWAAECDPTNGAAPRTRTPHVLRRPAIEALKRLGLLKGRKGHP
jgi:hypothetical protein